MYFYTNSLKLTGSRKPSYSNLTENETIFYLEGWKSDSLQGIASCASVTILKDGFAGKRFCGHCT